MTRPATATVADLVADFLAEHPVDSTPDHELRAARYRAGLAFPDFRAGFGGLGLSADLHPTVENLFLAAGCKDWLPHNIIGLAMAAPTIHAHGTDEQRRTYLQPLFVGEDRWCQLFSEPDAGSDLASLTTRAVLDGDRYIVTGQKVWSSLAHVARWGLLLARTDPDQPRHRGLSYFVVDMTAPGVDVRPLRQITGQAEFNEVFLDGVVVPVNNRIGAAGDGWKIAMTTLGSERGLTQHTPQRGEGPISQALGKFRTAAAAGTADSGDRNRLIQLWIDAETNRLTNLRHETTQHVPGLAGSIAKLRFAELNKAIYELCLDLSDDGMLFDSYAMTRPEHSTFGDTEGDVRTAFLRSLANSIEGGTSEIMRNILGERVLGLPREPSTP